MRETGYPPGFQSRPRRRLPVSQGDDQAGRNPTRVPLDAPRRQAERHCLAGLLQLPPRLSEMAIEGKNFWFDQNRRMWTLHEDGFRSTVIESNGRENERLEPRWGLSIAELDQIEAAVREQERETGVVPVSKGD